MTPDSTPDTTQTGTDATQHDAGGRYVPVGEAAAALGVTPDAIRARLRRGTLEGEKRDQSWYVRLASEDRTRDHATPDATRQATPTGDTMHPVGAGGIDLEPLARLVDDLTKRNAELAGAAAAWQARAHHLEERLQALEAGPIATPEAPGGPESAATPTHDSGHGGHTETTPAGRWGRLWRRLIGG